MQLLVLKFEPTLSFCTRDDGDRDRTFDLVLGHDGVDPDILTHRSRHDEKLKKRRVHDFIFECGEHLDMKTLVMAAASTICQRYYAQRSLRGIPTYVSTREPAPSSPALRVPLVLMYMKSFLLGAFLMVARTIAQEHQDVLPPVEEL